MGQKFACVEGRKYPCNQYHFASQQLGVLKKNRDQSRIFHSNNLNSDWIGSVIDNKIDNIKRLMVCVRLNQQADLKIVFLHDFIIWLYCTIELDLNGNYFYLKLYNLIKISCFDTLPLSNIWINLLRGHVQTTFYMYLRDF